MIRWIRTWLATQPPAETAPVRGFRYLFGGVLVVSGLFVLWAGIQLSGETDRTAITAGMIVAASGMALVGTSNLLPRRWWLVSSAVLLAGGALGLVGVCIGVLFGI